MNLLFTAPNRSEVLESPTGKMHSIELTEEAIAKDPVLFEDLVHAVYYQITSLDFLNSDSPINTLGLENPNLTDIKHFCKKLVEIYKEKNS